MGRLGNDRAGTNEGAAPICHNRQTPKAAPSRNHKTTPKNNLPARGPTKSGQKLPLNKKIITADRWPTPQGELDPVLGSPAPWQDATCPSEMTVQAQGQPLLSTSSFSRLPAKSTCPTCCQHEHNLLLQMEHRPRHSTLVLPGCSFRLSSSLASFTTSMTKTFNLSFALLPSGQAFQQMHLSSQPSL